MHNNSRVVKMPTLLSPVASEVPVTTTPGAVNVDKMCIITIPWALFQYKDRLFTDMD